MKLIKASAVMVVLSNDDCRRLSAFFNILVVADRTVKADKKMLKSKKKKPKESNSLDRLIAGSRHSGPCFYRRVSLSLSDKFH